MDRFEILELIRAQFVALGYQSFPSCLTFDRRDVWLRRDNDPTHRFATIVYLQYKPSFRAYGVLFGVVEDNIRQQLKQVLSMPSVVAFLAKWQSARPLEAPCWNLFNAGRALDWKYLSVPDLDAPASWQTELRRLQELLLDGLTHNVVDELTYARFLLRSDAPFEWWTSDPVLRTAEIVLALMRQGYSTDAIASELSEYRAQIEDALDGGGDLLEFVKVISVYARQ
jgi:hypothetical protein